jgi:hypothetical protein
MRSVIWALNGNGIGYYGINLKSNENYIKKTSTTSKKVIKLDKDENTIDSWTTIAKAAESEGISAAKMSRCIKNNIQINNFKFVATK